MLRAGRRDRRVTFLRSAPVIDEYGETMDGWAVQGEALAAVTYGTGGERRQAAVEQVQQALTIRVLATAMTRAASEVDRIALDGRALNIVGIAPIGRTEIEFTAMVTGQEWSPPAGDPGTLDFSDPANSGLLALMDDDWALTPSEEPPGLDA